ncbi:MAG: hypothetical protein Q8R57_06635 [Bacteroidota bacterium]|nr:hypothetical protein [Bacteroidota bacterium]
MKIFLSSISKNNLYLGIGILLFLYVVARAFMLSMTHDESLSFTIINGDDTWKYTANNHLLNTKLMGICRWLFGNSAFSLRLPNILSFAIYLYASFLLISKISSTLLQILGFSILLLNPYLLDFFSLARGYGISLACFVASMYFLLKQIEIWKTTPTHLRNYFAYLVFSSAALFANLGMINYFLASHLVLIICSRKLIAAAILGLFGSIPIYFAFKNLWKLKVNEQLYFGTSSFKNSFLSILENSLYSKSGIAHLDKIILILVISSSVMGLIITIKKQNYLNNWFILFAINLVIISGFILENLIFGSNYPLERTAIFFIPLWGLTFIYALNNFQEFYTPANKWVNTLAVGSAIILTLHFINTSNLNQAHSWKYDAHTKDAIRFIAEAKKDSSLVSNHWLFEPTLKYYIKTENLPIRLSGCVETFAEPDFVYRYQDTSTIADYSLLKSFPLSNSNLMAKTKANE